MPGPLRGAWDPVEWDTQAACSPRLRLTWGIASSLQLAPPIPLAKGLHTKHENAQVCRLEPWGEIPPLPPMAPGTLHNQPLPFHLGAKAPVKCQRTTTINWPGLVPGQTKAMDWIAKFWFSIMQSKVEAEWLAWMTGLFHAHPL